MSGPVWLLHGLWYRAPIAWSLAPGLRREGFQTFEHRYPTRRGTVEEQGHRLAEALRRVMTPPRAFVAHSLGGLVLLRALVELEDWPQARVVLLGTPLAGSEAARRCGSVAAGRWLLGAAADDLAHGADAACCAALGRHRVGMVAGTRPLGLGLLVGAPAGPSDGTVAVAETRVDGLTDRVEVPANHTSMLFSGEVRRLAAQFLRVGRFRTGN